MPLKLIQTQILKLKWNEYWKENISRTICWKMLQKSNVLFLGIDSNTYMNMRWEISSEREYVCISNKEKWTIQVQCIYSRGLAAHQQLSITWKTKLVYNFLIDRQICFWGFDAIPFYMAAKYSLLPFGSGFIDFSPGFHPAGQTSSGFSCTYCKACTKNLPEETAKDQLKCLKHEKMKDFPCIL